MKFPLVGSDQLPYSTVRIEGLHFDGAQSVGTAFFFQFTDELGTKIPCLVTNKHVVENCEKGRFFIHTAGSDLQGNTIATGTSLAVEIDEFMGNWIYHPNPRVDLCVMLVGPLVNAAKQSGAVIYSLALNEALVEDAAGLEDLLAISNVFMVGYPIGLWDETNNMPLIRRGITAVHPSCDFNGEPIGCIDIAALPGSSGSPIIIFDEGAYATRTGTCEGTRIVFLGVLFGGPQLRVDGILGLSTVPNASTQAVAVSHIPANLGYYFKAREVLAFRDIVLKKHRELVAAVPVATLANVVSARR
jgi:hypothetical protein